MPLLPQFTEPEMPEPDLSNDVVLSKTKSLADVSQLTEDSDLINTTDSSHDDYAKEIADDTNTELVMVDNDESDLHFSFATDSDDTASAPATGTPRTDFTQRKGLARSRMDSSNTPTRIRKEVLDIARASATYLSSGINSSLQNVMNLSSVSISPPRTVATVDMTSSSAMSSSGNYSTNNSKTYNEEWSKCHIGRIPDLHSVTRTLFIDSIPFDDIVDIDEATSASHIKYSKRKRSLTVSIDECSKPQFDELLQQLTNYEDVLKIQIYRTAEPLKGWVRTVSECILFFAAVRDLPNVEDVTLWNFNNKCTHIVTSFIQKHPTLKNFHLHYGRGSVDRAFLEALATVPSLKTVVLEMREEFSLSVLLSSKTITSIKVDGDFFFGKEAFLQFTHALGKNYVLRCLDLKPTIHIVGLRALAIAMGENKMLRKLKFSYRPSTQEETRIALNHLLRSLSSNSTLEHVENRRYNAIQATSRERKQVDEWLKSHPTLQRFQFILEGDCACMKEGGQSSGKTTYGMPQADSNTGFHTMLERILMIGSDGESKLLSWLRCGTSF